MATLVDTTITNNVTISQNTTTGNISVGGNVSMNSGGLSYDLAAPMGVSIALSMRLSPHMGMPTF